MSKRFVEPMLAATMPADFTPKPNEWAVEEKYDGHRMCVSISPDGKDLFGKPDIQAFSRNMIQRDLPGHIEKELALLPSGIYDGELMVPGQRSYGVTVLEDSPKLVLYIFDVVDLLGASTLHTPYSDRRKYLEEIWRKKGSQLKAVRLSESFIVPSADYVKSAADAVWKRDGEGLILKRLASKYQPGKRPKDGWIKVKQLRSAVMIVTGYEEGRGKLNTGQPCCTVILRDSEGNVTSVKALNDYERLTMAEDPRKFIGRALRIDYQERTPDGSYRHPRWDRWEDE